ncbi:MAG: helix-turn-helix transcriptional regulator [Clostridia bacterium]|nr:helix-turn-helix transcriptional regulator [Clostridia bacterium]
MYGQRIKELRLERGLTQNDLAKILNTTQRSISKYETEYLDLSTNMIITLCTYFNVSADYLLGLTDEY